jgi:hypothetical protein
MIHNMLTFILDPRFKSLKLIFSFIVHKYGVAIIKEYDRKSLFSIFFKSYHRLHSLFEVESSFICKVDEGNILDIF